jgi:nucleotide-binding universal stress UspA family protein
MDVRTDERRPAGRAFWIAQPSERAGHDQRKKSQCPRTRDTDPARRGAQSRRSKREDAAAPIVAAFARIRGARLVVLGARRGWLRRSVSRTVIKRADRPVLVAPGTSIHSG